MVFTETPNMSLPNNEFAKIGDPQSKPQIGDSGSGGGSGNGAGSSAPPPKIARTDGFQLTKLNGTGINQ